MALRLYNTLTSKKEDFRPADKKLAKIYVCGPTVYDYMHLGHVRCYVVYDVLIRHLRASGQALSYVRNITDVDDKIVKRASENSEDPIALAARFTDAFHEDMGRLGNLSADIEPKVSEHIQEIHDLIERLLEGGHAYEVDGDVYFDVGSFPDYGKLSHRSQKDMLEGASQRVDQGTQSKKKSAADFALWKGVGDESNFAWDSPWGRGRPGWHIECSAMSMKHLGESFDLHGGGLDLVFPHHENEIAQSEAATKAQLCKHWMHCGFLEVDKIKMSKSLGNFFTARQLFEKFEPEAIRFAMMTVQYRGPFNLEWNLDGQGNVTGFPQFEEAENRLGYLYRTMLRLENFPDARIKDSGFEASQAVTHFPNTIQEALDDDLNMPIALSAMSEFLKASNELVDKALRKKGALRQETLNAIQSGFSALQSHLGIGVQEPTEILGRIRHRRALERGVTAEWIEQKIEARKEARNAKDFAKADAIREELTEKGVELLDGAGATTWEIS